MGEFFGEKDTKLYLNSDGKKAKNKLILNVCLFVITFSILIYFCISNNNLTVLIQIFPQLDYFWLILAFVSMFLSWLFDSFVIRGILSDMYNKKYRKLLSFKLTMVGQFFSAITPMGVGGQPMQILHLIRNNVPTGISISVLVRKFLIYQFTMASYSLLIILSKIHVFSSYIPGFVALSLIGFVSQCFIVALLLLFYINKSFTEKVIALSFSFLKKIKLIKNPEMLSKSLSHQLELFTQNNDSMRKNKSLNFKLFVYTFLQLTFLFLVPFFIFKSFKYPGYPIIDMISAQGFVTMISSYTPLPGAAGTTEGSFLLLFSSFFTPEVIPSAMLICRFITYYTNIIIGLAFIKIEPNKLSKKGGL